MKHPKTFTYKGKTYNVPDEFIGQNLPEFLKKAIAKGKRTGSLGDKMRLTGLMNTIKGRSLKRRHIRRKLKLDRKDINSLQQLKDIRLTNRNYNEKVDKLATTSLIKKSQKRRSGLDITSRNRNRRYEAIKEQFEKGIDLDPTEVELSAIGNLIDKKLGEFRDSGKKNSLEAKKEALKKKIGKKTMFTRLGIKRSFKERADLKQAKIDELNNLQTNLDEETKKSIYINPKKMEKESLKLTNAVLDLKNSTNKFEKASKQKQVLNSLKMKEDMMNEFNTPLNPSTLSRDERDLRNKIDRKAKEAADREIKRSEELSNIKDRGARFGEQMRDTFARARGKEVITNKERQLRKQAKIKAKKRYKDELRVSYSPNPDYNDYKTLKQFNKEMEEKKKEIYQEELKKLRNPPPPLPSRKQFTQTSG